MVPASNCTLLICQVPLVCAPTVNRISMPVVAAAGTDMVVVYCVKVLVTVNVPVAICVFVAVPIVPNVSAVVAYEAVQVTVVNNEFAMLTDNIQVCPAKS